MFGVVVFGGFEGGDVEADEFPRGLGGAQVAFDPVEEAGILVGHIFGAVEDEEVCGAVVEGVEAEVRITGAGGEEEGVGGGRVFAERGVPRAGAGAVLRREKEVIGTEGVGGVGELGAFGVVIAEGGVEGDGGHEGAPVLGPAVVG